MLNYTSLLGQSVDTGGISDDYEMSDQSGEQKIPSDMPRYINLLVPGMPPLAQDCPDDGSKVPTIVYGDTAYGSRANIAACERAGVVPGILHKINVTPRSKGSGDAWGKSVRD